MESFSNASRIERAKCREMFHAIWETIAKPSEEQLREPCFVAVMMYVNRYATPAMPARKLMQYVGEAAIQGFLDGSRIDLRDMN